MRIETIRVRAVIVAVAGALLVAQTAFPQDLSARFDEYMRAAAQASFTGTVLVSRDGKVLFAKGYGDANEEFVVPNVPQTKFRLGSITKQFTAASILLLQERGKLTTSDRVCKYVTNCPAAWDPITIHHLLTHTSGIPSYTDVKSPEEFRQLSLMTVTPAGFVDTFKTKPLEFTVGERFKYDNSGYFLLGYLIETISGQSYEAFLKENIFGPLKMMNSGYDTHDRILANRATGYSNRNGVRINSAYLDMTVPYAAGSLYSTVEDLFTWNEALFSDSLLSAKSREAMLTVNQGNYAYGVTVNRLHNRTAVSHAGGINGFNTELARFPDDRLTVVVLRNADYGAPGPAAILQALSAIALGEKYELPRKRTAITVDPKIYDAYVGEYQLPNLTLVVSRDGDRLMAGPQGQPPAQLFPETEVQFFLNIADVQITFVKDDAGKVTRLLLNQGGTIEGRKIK